MPVVFNRANPGPSDKKPDDKSNKVAKPAKTTKPVNTGANGADDFDEGSNTLRIAIIGGITVIAFGFIIWFLFLRNTTIVAPPPPQNNAPIVAPPQGGLPMQQRPPMMPQGGPPQGSQNRPPQSQQDEPAEPAGNQGRI